MKTRSDLIARLREDIESNRRCIGWLFGETHLPGDLPRSERDIFSDQLFIKRLHHEISEKQNHIHRLEEKEKRQSHKRKRHEN